MPDQPSKPVSPQRRTPALRNTRVLVALAVTAVSVWSGTTLAQPASLGTIDASLIRQLSIAPGGPEAQRIAAFVEGYTDELTGTDRKAASDAIRAVLDPLNDPNVSVAFRAAFSEALLPTIDTMLESEAEPWHPLTALRIAGRLATEGGLQRVRAHLDSQERPERLFAAFSAELAFTELRIQQPAVVEASVLTMIADLGTILEENADTALVDAAARSLMEAGSIGRERLPNAGTAARRALASGLGVRLRGIEQVRSIDVENLRPILRGARDLRDWLVRHASEDADVARAAGGLAGDMVTFLDARVRAGAAVMRDESAFDAQFAAIAETLLEYADQRLATATGGKRAFTGPVALQEKLIAGDIRAFTTEALAAEQRLSSPSGPFKFKPERFVRP